MTPAEWRQETKKTLAQVAGLLGCSSLTSVLRYERGERDAPNSIARAYERASDGAVTAEDLERTRKRYLSQRTAAAKQKRRRKHS